MPAKAEAAITALIENGGQVKKAAETCGISTNSLRVWMGDRKFYAAYQAALQQMEQARRNLLLKLVNPAAQALLDALKPDAPTLHRLAAARIVFTETGRGIESSSEPDLVEAPASQADVFTAYLETVGGSDAPKK